jgi:hypothetical protein
MSKKRNHRPSRECRASMWLRIKYRLACALEAPFGDAFWFFHQKAVRLHDQLEQENAR